MIEVQLKQYLFQFRRLSWREEFALKFGKEDPRRVTLATALDNVSGSKPTYEQAMVILKAIPDAVLQRAYIIYRYKLPHTRIFSTTHLYKAPEPTLHLQRVEAEEVKRDEAADNLHRRMENTFGRQELAEQRQLEQQILDKTDRRNLVPKKTDPDDNPMGSFKAGPRTKVGPRGK